MRTQGSLIPRFGLTVFGFIIAASHNLSSSMESKMTMKKLIVLAAACAIALAIYLPGTVSNASADNNSVTFTKRIAPIFQKRCEECHREGGMAPMSLATYEESRPWARAIKEKVAGREMPPFHAAGAVGRYLNDPRLTDEEIATVVKW